MVGRTGSLTGTKARVAAISLLVALTALVACSGGSDSEAGASGGGDTMDRDMEAPAPAKQLAGDGGGGSAGGGSVADELGYADEAAAPSTAARLPKFGPSVIKTATVNIGLPKDEVGDALNQAISIAGSHGGFVLSSNTGRESRGTLTMRIPSQRFEAALAEIEQLGKVRSENISGQDVGQDFVDLEARLRNWETQEAVLLKLMDRAESVQDTIRVQGELSRVQLEIEQIRGRLRFLRDQTSYGTITASFGPVTPSPSAPNRFAQAWQRAVDLMQGFVEAVIVASGVVLPLAVLALLAYVVFRSVRPKLGT